MMSSVKIWFYIYNDIFDVELSLNGYNIYRCDRNNETSIHNSIPGGGIFSASMQIYNNSVEQVFMNIRLHFKSIVISTIYLPPGSESLLYESHAKTTQSITQF